MVWTEHGTLAMLTDTAAIVVLKNEKENFHGLKDNFRDLRKICSSNC